MHLWLSDVSYAVSPPHTPSSDNTANLRYTCTPTEASHVHLVCTISVGNCNTNNNHATDNFTDTTEKQPQQIKGRDSFGGDRAASCGSNTPTLWHTNSVLFFLPPFLLCICMLQLGSRVGDPQKSPGGGAAPNIAASSPALPALMACIRSNPPSLSSPFPLMSLSSSSSSSSPAAGPAKQHNLDGHCHVLDLHQTMCNSVCQSLPSRPKAPPVTE